MSDTAPAGTSPTDAEDVLHHPQPDYRVGPSAEITRHAPPTHSMAVRWIRLARPRLLILSLAPTISILALLWTTSGRLLVAPAIVSILAVTLVQAGANLLDEYLEHERSLRTGAAAGAMESDEAGARLNELDVTPLDALRASIGLLVAGSIVGIPLVFTGGFGVALLGIAGLGAAFLYSSTSYALKRVPGGEAIIFLVLGPGIAAAVTLAQGAQVGGPALFVGCAFGLLALAVVQATQVRSKDRHKWLGQRTLAHYIGVGGSRVVYGLSIAGAFVLVALLALPTGAPHGALAVLLAVPAALVAFTGMLRARTTAARVLLPRQTLQVYTLFALWLILGLIASGIVARALAFASRSGA